MGESRDEVGLAPSTKRVETHGVAYREISSYSGVSHRENCFVLRGNLSRNFLVFRGKLSRNFFKFQGRASRNFFSFRCVGCAVAWGKEDRDGEVDVERRGHRVHAIMMMKKPSWISPLVWAVVQRVLRGQRRRGWSTWTLLLKPCILLK